MLPRKFTGGSVAARRAAPTALDRMQRVISNEPGLISDVLRPQPVFAEANCGGYRVYPGRNARAFAPSDCEMVIWCWRSMAPRWMTRPAVMTFSAAWAIRIRHASR